MLILVEVTGCKSFLLLGRLKSCNDSRNKRNDMEAFKVIVLFISSALLQIDAGLNSPLCLPCNAKSSLYGNKRHQPHNSIAALQAIVSSIPALSYVDVRVLWRRERGRCNLNLKRHSLKAPFRTKSLSLKK